VIIYQSSENIRNVHEEYESLTVSSIVHPVENSKFKQIFTLFDPTHLFKNIRNNWCTEKTQTLESRNPETGEMCSAKWKDLVKLYKVETDNSILRETKLDYTTLYPNNFEKQKVQYVVNIFNEKTITKLSDKSEMHGTYVFVELVTRLWNILNIRSSNTAKRMNDTNRAPFTDSGNQRFGFLLQMATMSSASNKRCHQHQQHQQSSTNDVISINNANSIKGKSVRGLLLRYC